MIQKLSCYNLPSPEAMLREGRTPQHCGLESWYSRTSHISLTTLAKEAPEHLFCKQGSAVLLCACAGG